MISIAIQETMNKWAVITGAGSGIGAALCKMFAGEGFKVLAIGRRLNAIKETQASSRNPENIVVLSADIATEHGRADIFNAIPPDDNLCFLIQNAAVGVPNKLEEIKCEEFEYAMAVNVTAPLMLTQGFLKRLDTSHGRILHLGTGVAFKAQIGTATYGITKMAFHRLYEQLQVDLKPFNILIANMLPGVVDTEGLWEHIKLAKQQSLPHVEYFDHCIKENLILSAEDSAKFMKFVLLETTNEEYSTEWNIHDQSHWNRWKNV